MRLNEHCRTSGGYQLVSCQVGEADNEEAYPSEFKRPLVLSKEQKEQASGGVSCSGRGACDARLCWVQQSGASGRAACG